MAKKMPKYLTERIQYMIEQNVRVGSDKSYRSANNHYINFCYKYNYPLYPITEMKWLYYISDSLSLIKASSINTYITGIKYHASINGYPVNTSEMYQYKQAKKSLKNVFDAKNNKLRKPFTFDMIKNAYKYF